MNDCKRSVRPLPRISLLGVMESRSDMRGLILALFCSATLLAVATPPSVSAIAGEPELERYALTHAGDAERGKKLFNETQRTKCGLCHRVGEKGPVIGPNLTSIGGKFDRPHLIESLLYPSEQIVEGYRGVVLLTSDGTTVSGVIQKENKTEITIADSNAAIHTIRRDEIEDQKAQKVSLMPTGLADSLTRDEFTDLIAYLETLRSGGNGAGATISGPVELPKEFQIDTLVTGMTGATALEVLPDGRLFICEQTGSVRIFKDGKLLDEPLLTLPVDSLWERGVIGVTVDPDFPVKPLVYVCWVAKEPYPHHRISRFEVEGDKALAGSEKVLLVGDDQSKMGGNVPAGHQGGALHFGSDGKLYIGIGEQTAGKPSQALNTFLGKILRINSDGSIPRDNPFIDQAEGKYRAIWTLGMRNPFTFAVRPTDGLILINDVGGNFEEINVGTPGGNYGWPIIAHGPAKKPGYVDPIHWYPEASISGGDFLANDSRWPQEYRGQYFFADFKHGWIHTVDPANAMQANRFAHGLRRPVDIRFGPEGQLYVLLRNAWVIDNKFEGGTSSLLAIRPH